jgi:hypothetical protein
LQSPAPQRLPSRTEYGSSRTFVLGFSAQPTHCKKHNKRPGMGGVYDPPLMAMYIGMRMILSGGDLGFLMAGAKARAAFLRGVNL